MEENFEGPRAKGHPKYKSMTPSIHREWEGESSRERKIEKEFLSLIKSWGDSEAAGSGIKGPPLILRAHS